MTEQRVPGSGAILTVGGVRIYRAKITPKPQPKFGDTTDDSNYDPTSNLVHTSQLKCAMTTEIAVEGLYRKDTTPSALIAKVFDGNAGPQAVTFTVASGFSHFGGYYDITDLSLDVTVTDVVKISFTLKSNGVITANS